MKRILLLVLSITIVGCSSSITYESFPQSAMVVCNGVQRGYTPMTVYYDENDQSEILNVSSCKAVWMSGAESRFGELVRVNHSTSTLRTTAERPENIPNAQFDYQFDYQKKREDQIQDNIDSERKIRQEALQLDQDRQKFKEQKYQDQKRNISSSSSLHAQQPMIYMNHKSSMMAPSLMEHPSLSQQSKNSMKRSKAQADSMREVLLKK